MAERGIIGYGTYVPYWRLDRSRITAAMGAGGGRGHRAVASYDEDTTTLGVEAARNCLRGGSGDASVDRVIFSTSNPAYLDKTNATAIHAALNLPSSVTALDLNGAPRSIEAALGLALNAPGDNLMVLSDIRTGRPTSGDEASGGDGAAAFLIGDGSSSPIIAHELGSATEVAEFLDRYRQPGDDFSRVWEERFGEQAYLPLAQRAVERALAAAELTIDDIDGVSVTGMHARAARGVSRLAGDKLVNDLTSQIGNAGGAQTGLVVASILDDAEPNQNYLIIRLADGATATVMHTTDAIADYEPFRTVGSQIEGGNDALDYNQYLTWRGFLDREPPRRPDPERPGAPPAFRSEDWKYALIGSRDRGSGAIHMPPMRVSMEGGAVDDMEPVRMADIPATIATFTVDRLAFSLSPPMVAVVIDYDGGGRFQAEMTDVDPDEVRIGDRVEMTFRRLYTAEGIHNYFWKARPAAA